MCAWAVEAFKAWENAKVCVEEHLSCLADYPTRLPTHHVIVYSAIFNICSLDARHRGVTLLTDEELLCQFTYWLQKAAGRTLGRPQLYRDFARRLLFYGDYIHQHPGRFDKALGKPAVKALACEIWRRRVDRHVRHRLLTALLPAGIAQKCLDLADPPTPTVPSTQPWTPHSPPA